MVTITRRLEWVAMHRLPQHEGKCRAFHGHQYAAEVSLTADRLDDCGRVIDFSVVKELLGGWIDRSWDHTAIFMESDPDPAVRIIAESNAQHGRPVYWLQGPPTAENIVIELARVAKELLEPRGVRVVRIKLWETPHAYAEWEAPRS